MSGFGLLGKRLAHSYSPQIHSYIGDYEYKLYERSEDELGDFLEKGDFAGLNVTVPYKKAVIPFCSELSDRARKIGSVNTLVRRNGGLYGDNTDYCGFLYMVKKSGVDVAGKKAIVLGSGGASLTVCAVLKDLGAESVTVISRSSEDNYGNIKRHFDAEIIVNTTPVGMYPKTGESVISLESFKGCKCVYDIVYNPARTQLLLDAERLGIKNENGLSMLVAQATAAAEVFLDKKIDSRKNEEILKIMQPQMQNIILIGMPGCGKSTVGKALAKELDRKFVDIDKEIQSRTGKTIPKIFEESGEEGFRKAETEVTADICKASGLVIATGGGCVTRNENYPLMHQNGRIFWIKRDLKALPVDGRPLSQKTDLEEMYKKRRPLYESFADEIVSSRETPELTAKAILELISK